MRSKDMNKRENIIRAIRRQETSYIPYDIVLCESQINTLKRETGYATPYEYFDLPYRRIRLNPTQNKQDFTPYYTDLPKEARIDEFGVAHIPSEITHFSQMYHPMKDLKTVEEIHAFPLPDLSADYRFEGLSETIDKLKEEGLLTVYYAVQVFEPTWYLRSMEELLMDMLDEHERATACLERLTALQEQVCKKIAQCGIDMIVYGDDVGTQRGMMLSQEMWRKWLKPTMARCIQAAKAVNPELIAYYHSDGNIEEIIEDLIEIGVDVLNPVQPECMDLRVIKAKYGERLSFWGGIGTQTTMPFGTPEDVKQQVKEVIEILGAGGGLVVAPTHLIEPEVPWENIVAFYEAVKTYGKTM